MVAILVCMFLGGISGSGPADAAAVAMVMLPSMTRKRWGRILTIRDERTPVPIELGAEFVHGTAEEVVDLAREARLVICDIHGERWRATRGKLTPMDEEDFWRQLGRVMSRLDPQRTPDRSFQEFLDRKPGGAALAHQRTLAREFVEGFHAADLTRVSERALANGGAPEDPDDERQGRILDGYDRVPGALDRAKGPRHRVCVGNVAFVRIAHRSARQRLDRVVESRAVATDERKRCAHCRESLGDRKSDAAPAASDDCDLACESEVH